MIFINKKKEKVNFSHTYYQDDLFIAEFPKSGVTWMTTMLAYIEEAHSPVSHPGEFERPVGWGIIPRYISDDSIQVPLSPYRSKIFGGRIIKTHSKWEMQHQRCIYLYRHPARVMVSYWVMLKSYGQIDKSMKLETFCLHKDYGLPAWRAHVNSWLHESSLGSVIFFLSYENLEADTAGCMKRICNLFGIRITNDCLDKAVNASSRAKMIEAQSLVEKMDIRHKEKNAEYSFIGQQNRGLNDANSIRSLVDNSCSDQLALLNRLG